MSVWGGGMRAFVDAGSIAALRLDGLGSVDQVYAAAAAGGWPFREIGSGRCRRREWFWPTLPARIQRALVGVYHAVEGRRRRAVA